MINHNSAQLRDETPHATNSITNNSISNAVKRRARSLINDRTIDKCARAFIQHTLETEDPYLPKLVRRVDAGESILTIGTLEEGVESQKEKDERSKQRRR